MKGITRGMVELEGKSPGGSIVVAVVVAASVDGPTVGPKKICVHVPHCVHLSTVQERQSLGSPLPQILAGTGMVASKYR